MKSIHTIDIITMFNDMDIRFKILRLKFPDRMVPYIGMQLKSSNDNQYTISGIIFEQVAQNTWDCRISSDCAALSPESKLYLPE